MAKILSIPEIPHNCSIELDIDLGFPQPAGTRAGCSCGIVYVFYSRRKKLGWLYEFLNDHFSTYFQEDVRGWMIEL